MATDDDHTDARGLGGLTGLVLTGAILYFCVQLAATANIDKYDPHPMAPLYFIAVAWVVVPLVLFNIGVTAYLLAKSAAGPGLLALMWLAPLAACLAHPILVGHDQAKRDALERAHPSITEHHVNLTGRTFWLPAQVSSLPILPGASAYVQRKQTLEKRADPMIEYAGQRLAPGFTRMKIFLRKPKGAPDMMKPVRAVPWPDLSAIVKPDGSGMTLIIDYHYFHYPGHVDVVPTLNPLSPVHRSSGLPGPLLDVYPHNLSGAPVARIQIDGKEVGLLDPIRVRDKENCTITPGAVINSMAAPLHVRWQTVQPGATWQEATVSVPPFRQARAGNESIRSNAVHVYFLADGSVAAQRVQEIFIDAGITGVRITEPDAALAQAKNACGTAAEVHRDYFEKIGN